VTHHRSSPRRISGTLDALRGDWAPETLLADAQRAWTDAVGETIAAEAQPVSERGGVLTIGCSSAVWAQELDLMAPTILERLNSHLRLGRIARLRCTVRG
jgi:predicted nucleic acid-binding Zn ribbon protein